MVLEKTGLNQKASQNPAQQSVCLTIVIQIGKHKSTFIARETRQSKKREAKDEFSI
jgi:hypothetical protein